MIANADDFRAAFSSAHVQYEVTFRPQLRQLEEALADGTLKRTALIDESREIHAREYIVNSFLAALNWRMTSAPTEGLPNLVPETAIASEDRGTRRYMDYLGIEAGTTRPLLLVETKRPRTELPRLANGDSTTPPERIVARGLRGEGLTGTWNKWLSNDVGDYIRSLHAKAGTVPKRVVITNGDWLILLADPEDAFLGQGEVGIRNVLVCEARSDILRHSQTLFESLEHSRVLSGVRPLSVAELPFYVDPHLLDTAMHGLHLLYDEEPGIHQLPAPRIKVAPILFLGSKFGGWVVVEEATDYDLPRNPDGLSVHLEEVQNAAEALLLRVNRALGTMLAPRGIDEHYSDGRAFAVLPAVIQKTGEANGFRLVTGASTHYLRPASSIPNCPFHNYAHAAKHVAAREQLVVLRRSTKPRSFFYSTEEHHCAHADVRAAKAAPVLDDIRCGPRSRGRGAAFCEIWPFESHLCCRTCVYESVCTAATVFRLPCTTGSYTER